MGLIVYTPNFFFGVAISFDYDLVQLAGLCFQIYRIKHGIPDYGATGEIRTRDMLITNQLL
jgi:hypothetical protein